MNAMNVISTDDEVSGEDALLRLMAGNARFLDGKPKFSRTPKTVLANLAGAQQPYATILGCSDSRVPPELLFDAGFGGLFVIRVAGNVVSPEVMGSMQYAGAHLRTRLFMVLGHEDCGAVKAALAVKFEGAKERSRIQRLLQDLLPGLDGLGGEHSSEDLVARAVEANVRWSMRQLLETPEGREATVLGSTKLVGAVYHTASGRVRLLP